MSDYQAAAFYVVAHLDDWQLFMNPNASRDLADGANKVVFIHTTGDDAGEPEVFWRAKEEAVIASIRLRLAPLRPLDEVREAVVSNGHTVHRWSGANALCYFLRVPDGNGVGTGYPLYGHQSLHRLRTGEIDVARTVDESAEYAGWQDFVDTLQAIIDAEAEAIPAKGIDHPETDEARNPGDHSDHVTTGLAVEAMANYPEHRRTLHVGYSILDSPPDLLGEDLYWKVAQFAAYDKVVFDLAGHSTVGEVPDTYIGWCLRTAQWRALA